MVTLGGPVSQVTTLSVEVDADDGLPARPVAAPAVIDAITVPFVVIPVTATRYSAPPPVTVTVFVPPEVPVIATSAASKLGTVSLNTTANRIGLEPVGSGCADPSLIVTVGPERSIVTTGPRVGAFVPPTSLNTAPPEIRRITVPIEHPVSVTVYAAAEPAGAPITQPVAVPRFDRSLVRNPVTGTSNVTSNTSVAAFVTSSLLEVPESDDA